MKVFAVDGTMNVTTVTLDKIASDIRSRAVEGDVAFLFDTHTYGEAQAVRAQDIFVGSGSGAWLECVLVRASELGASEVYIYGDGFWLGKGSDCRGMNVQQVLVGSGPFNNDFPVVATIS